MALTSPGVEVTIIDESQYIPAATNSVPYVLLATASNKVSGSGVGVAPGTLAQNANKVYLITSQRDLAATYGVPFFYKTTNGTPINGYELNEYGLLAAYSALGVSNRCYVQRVDIDLAELTASLNRPTGNPENGTYWLDTANSLWGIFQWTAPTNQFANQVPIVITDTADIIPSTTIPLQTVGSIGDYAVNATSVYNPIYFKRGGPTSLQTSSTALSSLYNTWVLIGSDDWRTSWPTISGTNSPGSLTAGDSIVINTIDVPVPVAPNNTMAGLAEAVNNASIPGVYAAVVGNKFQIYANSLAESNGSIADGEVDISNGTNTPLTALGITAQTYWVPDYIASTSNNVPRWGIAQAEPHPTGSVWIKTNNVNLGINTQVKKYNGTLGTFVLQACPNYASTGAANNALDPSGGGKNIPTGTTISLRSLYLDGANPTATFQIFERLTTGPTIITGKDTTPGPFTPGWTFTISSTQIGSNNQTTPVTATIGGTGTLADFISAVSAANVPGVSATVNSNGAVVFTQSFGGDIQLTDTSGNAIANAGFDDTVQGVTLVGTVGPGLYLSNWVTTPTFTYTASATAPDQDPPDGRLWYYSATNQADIMIQNNGAWVGYQTVSNDVRGFDLTLTNPTGPIISATPPLEQTDGTDLVYGDLWIDSSDLENYPMLYRYDNIDGNDQWVLIDNTDQTTNDGILFADARWATNGTTNPISDPLPTIESLLTSDYLDLDAPSPDLYPEGILLWNTRRSGFNVKRFVVNYFNLQDFPPPAVLPAEKNAWVTASGNKFNGSPYMGRQSQRALIVQALRAGIDTSVVAREEQVQFNLIACPQYPELAPNMIALNNERNNTAFTIVDTPLRLTPDEIVNWATNNQGLGLPTADGLILGDVYAGAFYPSCTATDPTGSTVVTAPSHMMIRTIIRSDEVSFPWFAPAGTRRGVVDNALQLGYINAQTGEFQTIGVNQGIRDVLYENNVNPITFVPGVGITNFGNHTLTSITSALDRINVARLISFIRARLEVIGKQFLFEPNDQITRNEITNAINSLMLDLVAKRGIYDYLVVCDLSNNTPARIDRNELYVDIAIEPVKAVEFIYIPVRIKNTGEIASQTSSRNA